MEIVVKNIDELIPYVNNTRTHSDEQVQQIASSIKEFGFTNPILIDKDGGVIAGHGRIMGAKLLKMKDVPTIILDGLSEAQIKAYIIADNKLALNAGWNDELLKIEIEALHDMDFDIDLLGFDAEELEELDIHFDDIPLVVDEDNADDVPEPVEIPCLKLGDIVELGSKYQHRILCGSATEADDVNKLMNGDLADQFVTDPPYNVAYVGKTKKALTIKNDEMDNDNFREFLRDAFKNADNVLKEGGGLLYLACRLRRLQFSWSMLRYKLESKAMSYLEKTNSCDGKARLSLEARTLFIWMERRCWTPMGYGQKTNNYLRV